MSLQPEIEANWKSTGPAVSLKDIQEKLKSMLQCLSKWSSEKIGSITRQKREVRKRLQTLMNKPVSVENDKEIRGLRVS